MTDDLYWKYHKEVENVDKFFESIKETHKLLKETTELLSRKLPEEIKEIMTAEKLKAILKLEKMLKERFEKLPLIEKIRFLQGRYLGQMEIIISLLLKQRYKYL
jgi:uncharacterized membrane protein YgaE (UPF0421/DUF939 family)